MPMNRERYPLDWNDISLRIRRDRAHGRCECTGECGRHVSTRCDEMNGTPGHHQNGTVVLTVAHLNHLPTDCREDNLKAMCQRCHLRYDAALHATNRKKTRERLQLPLFPEGPEAA